MGSGPGAVKGAGRGVTSRCRPPNRRPTAIAWRAMPGRESRKGLWLALLAGCGGEARYAPPQDAGPSSDAAADAQTSFEPTPPELPEDPALPQWECPLGWRSVRDPEEADISLCDPWPEGGPRDCADGEAHFPGEHGCTRIGPTCPAGMFAEGLPDEGVLYVQAGAKAGGDGSMPRPFGTIQDGLDAASSRTETILALSKGAFIEAALHVSKPVLLWGACAAETIVGNDVPSGDTGIVELARDARGLRFLTLRGPRAGVVVTTRSAAAELEGVVIRDVRWGIIMRTQGRVAAHDLLLRDVADQGVNVLQESRVDLSRAAFERAGNTAIRLDGTDSEVSATDVVVRHGVAGPDGLFGAGLEATGGARAEVTRSVFHANRGTAINIIGASFVGSDIHISSTLPTEINDAAGHGLAVDDRGSALVERGAIDRGFATGAWANGEGASLTLRHAIIRDIQPERSSEIFGHGVMVTNGAGAELDTIAVLRNSEAGIMVAGEGSRLDATDVTVRETRAVRYPQDPTNDPGDGLYVGAGAAVHLERAAFARNVVTGIVVDAATLEGSDWSIESTAVNDGALGNGAGMALQFAAAVTVVRLKLVNNRAEGIDILSGRALEDLGIDPGGAELATFRGTDVTVLDTRATESGELGAGIVVVGGDVEIDRAVLRGNRTAGLFAVGNLMVPVRPDFQETTIIVRNVLIDGTRAQDCADTSCAGTDFGLGASVASGTTVTLERFRVSGSALCGVQVSNGGHLELHDGELSQNPIGANVQDAEYDLDLLRDDVRYVGNGQNFDRTSLPVPIPFGL